MPMGTKLARSIAALALLSIVVGSASCVGTRELADPVLEIQSKSGRELAVATDYGVVFLGRSVQMGEIEIIAWYGDGPSVERSVVEPIGGGIYTAEPEIRVPSVPLSFRVPKAGESLVVVGRNGPNRWEDSATAIADARVQGILLASNHSLRNQADQVGAGVYRVDPFTEERRLVGLVSGVLKLSDKSGGDREYLTVVGPDDLWRLVTYHRDLPHKPRWVYRDDIL